MSESATIVQRLWNYCNMLRGDDEIEKEFDGRSPAGMIWSVQGVTPYRPRSGGIVGLREYRGRIWG